MATRPTKLEQIKKSDNSNSISYILKKNKLRAGLLPQTVDAKANHVTSRLSGSEPGGCQGSIQKLKFVRKVIYGKNR